MMATRSTYTENIQRLIYPRLARFQLRYFFALSKQSSDFTCSLLVVDPNLDLIQGSVDY
jgi:hypothetical protein